MSEKFVRIANIVQDFKLEVLNKGDDFDEGVLTVPDVNRPGLQLTGYFDYFDPKRIQIIGKAEINYLTGLDSEMKQRCYDNLFQYDIPAMVLSQCVELEEECLASAKKFRRTLLKSNETTVEFTSHMIEYLNRELAPTVTRHGVLLDVYGVGVLILGDSGIGKSETAIELVMRGHRLVADDAVEIRKISNYLVGSAPELIRHYIELRGIGVINVRQLFGMRAIIKETEIDMVVQLESWDEQKFYDRLGLEDHYLTIMEVKVPCITIPVRPGRNLASIVEVAAMNNRHRRYGYNDAQELVRRIDQHVDGFM